MGAFSLNSLYSSDGHVDASSSQKGLALSGQCKAGLVWKVIFSDKSFHSFGRLVFGIRTFTGQGSNRHHQGEVTIYKLIIIVCIASRSLS